MLKDAFRPGRAALMAFFTAGDGGEETTMLLARTAKESGADILELGIPFSDPIADGPAIQRATFRALRQGMTPRRALLVARRIREELSLPVVLLTYMNPFLHLEPEELKASGIEAVVIPDLALEESRPAEERLGSVGIPLVRFVAPTTPPERMAAIGRVAQGFVYLVSVTGVTGARRRMADEALATLALARRHISVPIAVGFGIAEPEDAARLAAHADGLIVGSALVEAYEAGGAAAVGERLRLLRAAVDSSAPSL